MAHLKKRNGVYYLLTNVNGKWVAKSLHTTDKRLAFAERDRANGRASALPAAPKKDLSFASLRTRYTEWASGRLALATINLRLWALASFEEITGASRISECTPDVIQRYVKTRQAAGVTPRTINGAIEGLKALVARAARQTWYSGPNPFTNFDKLPEPKAHPKWLSQPDIIKLMIAAQEDSRDAAVFFALGLFAGLRISEIVSARWEWFDFRAGLVHVRASHGWEPKDGDDRTIPLHSRLAEIIGPPRAAAGYLIAPDKLPGEWRYRYETRKLVARILAAAALTWVTPHTLRHTFASQLASAGVDLYKISQWLGHSDTKTTQIYAHLRPQDSDINRF